MAVLVEDVTMAKSQKSLRVKLSGSWYGAYLDSGLNAPHLKGSNIEAEIVTLEKGGPWIKAWKPSAATQGTASGSASQLGAVNQHSEGLKPNAPAAAAPHYAEPNPNVAPWWWPSVSNVWAANIAAGNIKAPTDLKVWALAVKDAAIASMGATRPTQDESIPF